jgi:hypothetical protein
MRALRGAAASFLLFVAVGLALAWPALRWPMVYDDLHLLRSLTPEERAQVWRGSWDPDGVEHAGFRPLTVHFNEARYRLFGENVVAHRLFLAALFAVYARLLGALVSALGGPAAAGLGAGVLLLCSRYSVYHYVWLTDGNHLLQGLLFEGAALCLLAGLVRRSGPALAASLAAFAAVVLVREDGLALVPVLLLFAGVVAPRERRRTLLMYSAALLAISLSLYAYRGWAVPEAPPPGFDLRSFAVAIGRALVLPGPESFDGLSRAVVWVGIAGALVALTASVRQRHSPDGRLALVFLAAAVLACTPALTFRRDDMLFFAVTFAALFYGAAVWILGRQGAPQRVVAGILLLTGLLGGAYTSRTFALNFHPDSARAVRWNAQMLYGPYSDRATIPPERRAALQRQLAGQGVTSAADLPSLGPRIGRARSEGPFRPGRSGELFFPPLPENDF